MRGTLCELGMGYVWISVWKWMNIVSFGLKAWKYCICVVSGNWILGISVFVHGILNGWFNVIVYLEWLMTFGLCGIVMEFEMSILNGLN